MAERPEALLSEFDADQNLMSYGLNKNRDEHTVYVQAGRSGGKKASES